MGSKGQGVGLESVGRPPPRSPQHAKNAPRRPRSMQGEFAVQRTRIEGRGRERAVHRRMPRVVTPGGHHNSQRSGGGIFSDLISFLSPPPHPPSITSPSIDEPVRQHLRVRLGARPGRRQRQPRHVSLATSAGTAAATPSSSLTTARPMASRPKPPSRRRRGHTTVQPPSDE